MVSSYKLRPTEKRKGSKDHYIISVHPSFKKKLGSFVVIERLDLGFLVQAKVLVNRSLIVDEVEIDQTLRNALAIENSQQLQTVELEFHPLKLTFLQKIRDVFSFLFGKRYLYFRASKASLQDMEKNLLKMPYDSFKLLGCELGDAVICSVPFKKGNVYRLKEISVNAYDIQQPVFEEKYSYSTEKLGIQKDIPPIFLDYHTRQELLIDELHPICVRRNIKSQFVGKFQDFGVILLISTLAIINIFPIENNWYNLTIMISIALVISILLVLLNIRGKLK